MNRGVKRLKTRVDAERKAPPGPVCLDELQRWSEDMWPPLLQNPLRAKALESMFDDDITFVTEFAGWDAIKWGLTAAGQAYKALCGKELRMHFPRASDIGPLQQMVLIRQNNMLEGGLSCVTGDIEDRITSMASKLLDSLMPDPNASP